MKKLLSLTGLCLLFFAGTIALAADGAALYTKSCSSCHGPDGTKTSMGSPVIQGEPADKILEQLKGYAAGTYGGGKKNLMVNIMKKHSSEEEMKALAEHIAGLH